MGILQPLGAEGEALQEAGGKERGMGMKQAGKQGSHRHHIQSDV